MKYSKSSGGAWVPAEKLVEGTKIKLVDEVVRQESKFTKNDGSPKTENVGKVRLQGDEQTYNIRLNWASVFGLIEAFGEESKDWIDKVLTVKTVRALVGDTMRKIIYLVPEGFELGESSDGKLEIRKVGGSAPASKDVVDYPQEDINPDDIPF